MMRGVMTFYGVRQKKVREQFGACGNCASLSHSTKDCPRSKKVMKKD